MHLLRWTLISRKRTFLWLTGRLVCRRRNITTFDENSPDIFDVELNVLPEGEGPVRDTLQKIMSDFTRRNIEHFDKRATSYDTSLKQALAKECSDAVLRAEGVEWDPNSTLVIDFACGTGLSLFPLTAS